MSRRKITAPSDNANYQAADDNEAKEAAARIVRHIEPPSTQTEACRVDALEAIALLQEHADRIKMEYVRSSEIIDEAGRSIDPKGDLFRFAQSARMLGSAWNDITQFGFVGFERDLNKVGASIDVVLDFGQRCDEMAKALPLLPNNIEAQIKREAVRHAFHLVKKYRGSAPQAGRNKTGLLEDRSMFSKVAAALWGHPNADMTSQCKLFLASPEGKAAKA